MHVYKVGVLSVQGPVKHRDFVGPSSFVIGMRQEDPTHQRRGCHRNKTTALGTAVVVEKVRGLHFSELAVVVICEDEDHTVYSRGCCMGKRMGSFEYKPTKWRPR